MKRFLVVLVLLVLLVIQTSGGIPASAQVPLDGAIIVDPVYRTAMINRQVLISAVVVDREGDPVEGVLLEAWMSGANPSATEVANTSSAGTFLFSYNGPNPGQDVLTIRPHPQEELQGFAPATVVLRRIVTVEGSRLPGRIVFDHGIYNDEPPVGEFVAHGFTAYSETGEVMVHDTQYSVEIGGANGPKTFTGRLDSSGRGQVTYTPTQSGLDTIAVTIGSLKSAAARDYDYVGCDVQIDCEVVVPSSPPPPCEQLVCPDPSVPDPTKQPALVWTNTLINKVRWTSSGLRLGPWKEISISPSGERTVRALTTVPIDARASGATATAQTVGSYSCVHNRTASGFTVSDTGREEMSGTQVDYSFIFTLYNYERARYVNGVGYTDQNEMCSSGGLDGKDGWRALLSGTGQAFSPAESYPAGNTGKSYRIGQAWATGFTGNETSKSLSFQVGGNRTPISVTGSVSQTERDELKGSISPPYPGTPMDRYALQSSNGWWQEDCYQTFGGCSVVDGSPDYQGSVNHALWEFKAGKGGIWRRVFPIHVYSAVHCSNVLNDCPQ